MTQRNGKVSFKTICGKWEGETLPQIILHFKQLEKCQREYYPGNLNSSNFLYFPSKKEPVAILNVANFRRKNLVVFHDVKIIRIYFSFHTYVSYICWQEDFIQEYVEIKNFFYNIWRFLRMAKINHSNSNC